MVEYALLVAMMALASIVAVSTVTAKLALDFNAVLSDQSYQQTVDTPTTVPTPPTTAPTPPTTAPVATTVPTTPPVTTTTSTTVPVTTTVPDTTTTPPATTTTNPFCRYFWFC
jgi:hypothetical protein